MNKPLKYILFAMAFLILVDQVARYIVDNQIRTDTDFFEQALASTDIDSVPKDSIYAGCQYHRVRLWYVVKTCISPSGFILGEYGELYPFIFWPPRSHFTSAFNSWWYYELAHTEKTAMHIQYDKSIVRNFIKDPYPR